MKILLAILLALVGTLILNGPIQSYADPQLDALLRITIQARDNLSINISQINNVPDEITVLFKQGSNETDALSKAVDDQDVVSARQHFLSAMKFFETTNDEINSLNATGENDQQQVDTLQLQSEIMRLQNIDKTLQTIAITNNIDFDFTPFDQLIQNATQALDDGQVNATSKLIITANQFMINAHDSLAAVAKQRTSDRAKDFADKQIDRLDKIENFNTSQNIIVQTPKITSMTQANSSSISDENSKDIATKLKKLVAEGKVDEALKVIQSLESNKTEN
jgi:hypothetical protein